MNFQTDNRNSFYAILGVEKTASTDEIKRAFKVAALAQHPDKARENYNQELYQRIQRAHEVLTDEKLRLVYNMYGENGLLFVARMQPLGDFLDLDPLIILKLNYIFRMSSLLVLILTLFPSFISIRADLLVNWSWIIVFIPAFIIDAFIAYLLIPRLLKMQSKQNNLAVRLSLILTIIYLSSFITLQILIPLRLDSIIISSWSLIFIPWYLMELFHLFFSLFAFWNEFKNGTDSEGDENTLLQSPKSLTIYETLHALYRNFSGIIIRLSQLILLILKFDSSLNVDWAVIFIPFYLNGCLIIIELIYSFYRLRKPLTQSQLEEQKAVFYFSLILFLVFGFLFYLGLGLLIARLSQSTGLPLASVILFPVFFILSLLFCCCYCCLPLIAKSLRDGDTSQMLELVPISRRIELAPREF